MNNHFQNRKAILVMSEDNKKITIEEDSIEGLNYVWNVRHRAKTLINRIPI